MSLWNKLCKIIFTDQHQKFDDKNQNHISRPEPDINSEEGKCGSIETQCKTSCVRQQVSRNVSVSRSGRYRQKARRRSVLHHIEETPSGEPPKIDSFKTQVAKLIETNRPLNSCET